VIAILAYVGDAVSVLSLSIMFSLSLAIHRGLPGADRLKIWALPALAVLVSFPLGYVARTWPVDVTNAGLVLAVRAFAASSFALAHVSLARPRS
jgi:hypothetical protein